MGERKKPVVTGNEYDKMTPLQWLLRVFHGSLIGVGSILPGVSGGVLCVLFGIYQPMMALLAHPFSAFKRYYKLFIPVAIGFVVGFLGLAKLVNMVFKASSNIAVCLFVGLIFGMLPSLYREAGKQGRNKGSWITFGISFAVLFAFLFIIESYSLMSIQPNIYWYFFCGIVWGLSLVVPGLSSSSILIFMGLYEPMTEGISQFNLNVLIPLALGILCTALLTARFINWLIEKHYSKVYHLILGVVLASTLLIIPLEGYTNTMEIIISIACALVGFFGAFALDRWGENLKRKKGIED